MWFNAEGVPRNMNVGIASKIYLQYRQCDCMGANRAKTLIMEFRHNVSGSPWVTGLNQSDTYKGFAMKWPETTSTIFQKLILSWACQDQSD